MLYPPGSFFADFPWMDVRRLPLFWRRAFVILFPLTGPLWCAILIVQIVAIIAFLPVALVVGLFAWPLIWAVEIWKE